MKKLLVILFLLSGCDPSAESDRRVHKIIIDRISEIQWKGSANSDKIFALESNTDEILKRLNRIDPTPTQTPTPAPIREYIGKCCCEAWNYNHNDWVSK